jgi:hypothetical protein
MAIYWPQRKMLVSTSFLPLTKVCGVLGNSPWPVVRQYLDEIARAVDAAAAGSFTEVPIALPPKPGRG